MAFPDRTFQRAVVRGIPDSLVTAALRAEEPATPVDLGLARAEHASYVDTLRSILPQGVIELPADEAMPDCVFVEDPVVVGGATALLCNPGHSSRAGEGEQIGKALRELGYEVHRMAAPASLDGGDVLRIGRLLVVGLSARTNQAGAEALRASFPEYAVVPVTVRDGLHLKSFMSQCGSRHVAVVDSQQGRSAAKAIERVCPGEVAFVMVQHAAAANCLWVNRALVHRAEPEYANDVLTILAASDAASTHALTAGELQKVDGLLTCSSVLLER